LRSSELARSEELAFGREARTVVGRKKEEPQELSVWVECLGFIDKFTDAGVCGDRSVQVNICNLLALFWIGKIPLEDLRPEEGARNQSVTEKRRNVLWITSRGARSGKLSLRD
jgi:hypothetical protein